MDVVALCPFAVGTLVWRAQRGDWTLTTCVKGTFRLEHGRDLNLHDTQDPICGEQRFNDAGGGSLRSPGDLAPYKPRADISLVGHAFAPGGQPVEALVARLSVGDIDKAIGLVGNRTWKEGPDGFEPSAPEPFTRMSLRYELAARAPDNPVGLDLAAAPSAGALALPNLEPVEDDPGGHAIGFGPIAPEWPPRRDLLGGQPPPEPATAAPEGFDFGYFNTAPRDQQVGLLRANARVVLENLHARHARLETRIPAVKPKAFFVDSAGRANEIALRCDTVWIDTDRGVLVLTWRGLWSVDAAEPEGTLVVAVEARGKEIRYKQVEALMRDGTIGSLGTDDLATEEPNPMGVRHDSVRPDGPAPPSLPPRTAAERPPRRDRHRDSDPSRNVAAGAARETAAEARTPRPPPPATVAAAEHRAAPAAPAPSPTEPTRAGVAEPALVPDAPPSLSAESTANPHTDRDGAPATDAQGLAWRDVSGHEASADALDADLERYAGIAAELAESPTDTGEVLATHGLDRAQWNELERRWTRTAETAAAGSTSDRFVSAFERARQRVRLVGAVDLDQFLRVRAAAADGDPAAALAAASLELDDLALLQRTWARRAARDPEIARRLGAGAQPPRPAAPKRSSTATATATVTTQSTMATPPESDEANEAAPTETAPLPPAADAARSERPATPPAPGEAAAGAPSPDAPPPADGGIATESGNAPAAGAATAAPAAAPSAPTRATEREAAPDARAPASSGHAAAAGSDAPQTATPTPSPAARAAAPAATKDGRSTDRKAPPAADSAPGGGAPPRSAAPAPPSKPVRKRR